MKKIYADFNDFASSGTLPLICFGSKESIAKLVIPLSNGEEIILSDGELKVIARVCQLDDGTWEARSEWDFWQ